MLKEAEALRFSENTSTLLPITPPFPDSLITECSCDATKTQSLSIWDFFRKILFGMYRKVCARPKRVMISIHWLRVVCGSNLFVLYSGPSFFPLFCSVWFYHLVKLQKGKDLLLLLWRSPQPVARFLSWSVKVCEF